MRLILAFALLCTACGECASPPDLSDMAVMVSEDLTVIAPTDFFDPSKVWPDMVPPASTDLAGYDLAPRCASLNFDGTYHEVMRYSRPDRFGIGRIYGETRVDVSIRGNTVTRPNPATSDQVVCDSGTVDPFSCRMYCCAGAGAPLIEYARFATIYEYLVTASVGTCRSPNGLIWTIDDLRFE